MAYIFGGETGETSESLKRKRDIAQRMLMARGAPRDVGEGLTVLGQAIAGRIAQNKLDKQQAAGMAKNREMLVGLLGGAQKQMATAQPYDGPNAAIDTPGSAQPAKKPIELGTDDLKAARTRGEPLDPVDIPGSAKTVANPMADGIVETARALGVDPVDLATAISYETAGTFDPAKRGPTTKWGQHRGLIQFGQPQAKRYGVDWNNPIESQLGADGAVAKYLKDTGVKPGMGLLDIYSAINAGGVGRYNRSDAAAGGAPGTVRDKVEKQMAGHRRKAAALLAKRSQQQNVRQATLPTPRPDVGGMVAQAQTSAQVPPQAMAGADRVSELAALYGITPEQAMAMLNGSQQPQEPVQVASLAPEAQPGIERQGILAYPQDANPQQANPNFSVYPEGANPQRANPQFLAYADDAAAAQPSAIDRVQSIQPVGRVMPGTPPVQQDMQRIQPSSEAIINDQAAQQAMPQGASPAVPQQAPQQVAQAMPPAGQGGPGINKDGFMVGVPDARPDPQAMENAKSLAQSAGLDPRWIDIAQSPYATPAMRQLAIQQIQNRLDQMNPDEMRQLQLEKARMEVEAMRNPVAEQPKIVELYDPQTGLPYKAMFNRQTGEFERVGGVKAPSGTQLSVGPDGTVQFQQGAGLKPLTESQSKDAVYSTRAEGALAIIDQFDTELASASGHVASKFGAFGNYFQTEGYQKAAQAGKEFLQAVLRKDTGAAITADEVREYGSVYLPMPGDSEAVIAQKRLSRQRALNAMKAGMPPAAILAQERALNKTGDSQPGTLENVPAGIDPEDWKFMTPEERRLFQ